MAATTPGKSTLRWQRWRFCAWRFVRRSHDKRGLVVLPRRWVVEHTFSCHGLDPGRRRAKDCGNLAETLATLVTLASIRLALRRLARAWVVNSTTRRLAISDDGSPQT